MLQSTVVSNSAWYPSKEPFCSSMVQDRVERVRNDLIVIHPSTINIVLICCFLPDYTWAMFEQERRELQRKWRSEEENEKQGPAKNGGNV